MMNLKGVSEVSRTKKGSKPLGWEYWGKRKGGWCVDRKTSHKMERMQHKEEDRELLKLEKTMLELTMELDFTNGEHYDDTVEIDGANNVMSEVIDFISSYHDEGYDECDPRYYELSKEQLEILFRSGSFYINDVLKLTVVEIDNT